TDGVAVQEAERLTRLLSASPDIVVTALTSAESAAALRTGKVAMVVTPVPQGDANTGDALPGFNCRFDPMRPESRMARLVFNDYLQRGLGRADVASLTDVKVTEQGSRYVDFLVPGLIGMSLMGGGFFGVGIAIVVARARRLLKMFAATPMKRSHYLLSFIFSRLIFWVLEIGALILFARLAFGFRIHGAVLSMIFLLFLGGFTFAGIGLLVAARPKTIQGVSGLSNLVMIPMWLLSGTFFSPARFPDFLQPFISALPLTALNSALRAVMNDGATLTSHWTEVCILLAWGVLSFVITLKIFRWQ
ncbi:MAG TPA: ABC transporter permease, partial [Pyrinomonadaceae bacterium]|nr:ABC transporter permease [Pyrinomonadaceae bacterium]